MNYFWVSLQMKPTASVLAKVSVEMTGVTMDNRTAPVKVVRKADTHYMGVGVRHAGDDGVAAYRIPGLQLLIKVHCLVYMMFATTTAQTCKNM